METILQPMADVEPAADEPAPEGDNELSFSGGQKVDAKIKAVFKGGAHTQCPQHPPIAPMHRPCPAARLLVCQTPTRARRPLGDEPSRAEGAGVAGVPAASATLRLRPAD